MTPRAPLPTGPASALGVLACARGWAWRLCCLLLWWGGATLPLAQAQGPASGPELPLPRWVLTTAERWLLDEDTGNVNIEPVTLPDLSTADRLRTTATVVYRLHFDATGWRTRSGEPPLLGLFIAHACSAVRVQLNGHQVMNLGTESMQVGRPCWEPQLGVLPWPLIEDGNNLLELTVTGPPSDHVTSQRRAVALSAVEVGPHAELARKHRAHLFNSSLIPNWSSGGLLLLALLTGCVLLFNRQETHLGYFMTMAVLYAVINVRAVWGGPNVEVIGYEGGMTALVSSVAWCFQRFVCRYADIDTPWLDRLAISQWVVLMFWLGVAPADTMRLTGTVWNTLAVVLCLTSVFLFFQGLQENRRRPMKGMATVFVLGLLVALVEWPIHAGWLTVPELFPLRWGVPASLMLMGGLQLVEFGRQAHQLQVVQRTLQSQVEQARQDIEWSFRRLADDRIATETQNERKRIAADLHDDLGAKLLTIVHTSRSDRIAALGREALDEMRLSVRGLTGRPMGLTEALADWRTEAMGRMASAGVEFAWDLSPHPGPWTLNARTMVQATRILREVFNNVLRHSLATECHTHTRLVGAGVEITIRDNGRGFARGEGRARPTGNGLLNMEHRARQLNGSCRVESSPGAGTVVTLLIPLDALPEGSAAVTSDASP